MGGGGGGAPCSWNRAPAAEQRWPPLYSQIRAAGPFFSPRSPMNRLLDLYHWKRVKTPPLPHRRRPFLTSIPAPRPPLLLWRSDRSGPDMDQVLDPDDPAWFCWGSFLNNTNSILWFSCRWRQNKWASRKAPKGEIIWWEKNVLYLQNIFTGSVNVTVY